MQKLIDANWHAIYKTQKLIEAKLKSFTVFHGPLTSEYGQIMVKIFWLR